MRMRAQRPATVAPGSEVIPGHQVVGLLQHGRRTDTYDAWSLERECRCVVKVLRADRADEPRVHAATLQEARLLRDLAHPHLVRCYEVHEAPLPAMVLETVPGSTVAALVDDAPLAVEDVAELGIQLASILGYLHRSGWLHLDLKPANVIVHGGRAVLIDLSLASRPGDGRPGAGTRGYLCPEQARGRDLGAACDVWGLGVTLLECLTGEMPYGDEATWDSGRRRRIPRRATRLLDDLAPSGAPFEPTLRRCLAIDPAARPSLAEVRTALSAATS